MAQNCWNLDIYVNFTSHYTVHTLLLKNPALSLLEQLIGEVNWTYHNSFSIIDYFNPICIAEPNGTYSILFTKCRWMPLLKVSSAFNEESTNSAFSNAENNVLTSMQVNPTTACSCFLQSLPQQCCLLSNFTSITEDLSYIVWTASIKFQTDCR